MCYFNFKEYSKNQRFLNEGIFDFFRVQKHITPISKLRSHLKESSTKLRIAQYNFHNNEWQSNKRTLHSLNLQSPTQILDFVKRHDIIYFPESESFIFVSELSQYIIDRNTSFLSTKKVERLSINIDQVIAELIS